MAQRIWLIKHGRTANLVQNLTGYALGETGPGWMNVHAVYAFTRKKHAQEYLRSHQLDHYEIVAVELPPSDNDARRSL
jgi:hypothetical protein